MGGLPGAGLVMGVCGLAVWLRSAWHLGDDPQTQPGLLSSDPDGPGNVPSSRRANGGRIGRRPRRAGVRGRDVHCALAYFFALSPLSFAVGTSCQRLRAAQAVRVSGSVFLPSPSGGFHNHFPPSPQKGGEKMISILSITASMTGWWPGR